MTNNYNNQSNINNAMVVVDDDEERGTFLDRKNMSKKQFEESEIKDERRGTFQPSSNNFNHSDQYHQQAPGPPKQPGSDETVSDNGMNSTAKSNIIPGTP